MIKWDAWAARPELVAMLATGVQGRWAKTTPFPLGIPTANQSITIL